MVANESNGHCVVVANGEFSATERLLPLIDAADLVIAADGGANALAQYGRYPDVLIGDLDSVSSEVLARINDGDCRLLRHPADKDETDTELALLEAVRLGARRITLLGALGGRIDHALANVLLLTLPALVDCIAQVYDGRSFLMLVRNDCEVRGHQGDLLSLIAINGDALGVRTEGLQYPLRDEVLRFGPARGISNVLLGKVARVRLRSGMLLLIHTPMEG
ncbi:MAG: thiamine diphosphokinase [Anaerolineae bacterium]